MEERRVARRALLGSGVVRPSHGGFHCESRLHAALVNLQDHLCADRGPPRLLCPGVADPCFPSSQTPGMGGAGRAWRWYFSWEFPLPAFRPTPCLLSLNRRSWPWWRKEPRSLRSLIEQRSSSSGRRLIRLAHRSVTRTSSGHSPQTQTGRPRRCSNCF